MQSLAALERFLACNLSRTQYNFRGDPPATDEFHELKEPPPLFDSCKVDRSHLKMDAKTLGETDKAFKLSFAPLGSRMPLPPL